MSGTAAGTNRESDTDMRKRWIIGGVAAIGLLGTAAAVVTHRPAPARQAASAEHRIIFATPQEQPGNAAVLAKAAEAAPGNADSWAKLGNAQLRTRAFPAAIASYRRAVAIDPNRAEIWSAMGEAYIQSERSDSAAMPKGASEAFDKALALDPQNLRARFYKTMERDFAGQHDEAIGEWLQQLRAAPMGSDADEAIRAALTFSINRNIGLIKAEMSKAIQAQPRVVTKDAGQS